VNNLLNESERPMPAQSFHKALPVFLLAGSLVCAAPRLTRAQAPPAPAPAGEVCVVSEALDTALPRLGRAWGLRLSAGAPLDRQRVTLFLKDARPESFRTGLRELLSAGPEAPVFWRKKGEDGWVLEESANRRKLAERLRDQDLELFTRRLEAETAWLRETGQKELAAAGPISRRGWG